MHIFFRIGAMQAEKKNTIQFMKHLIMEEKMRKREIILLFIGFLTIIMTIMYRITGTQGKAVLFGTALLGLTAMLAGDMLIYILWHQEPSNTWALVLGALFFLLLFGYGTYTELGVIHDLHDGTITTTLNDCAVTSENKAHGILGHDYYLRGTDHTGKTRSFPVTYASKDDLDGRATVTVEYYRNIGRLVSYR